MLHTLCPADTTAAGSELAQWLFVELINWIDVYFALNTSTSLDSAEGWDWNINHSGLKFNLSQFFFVSCESLMFTRAYGH